MAALIPDICSRSFKVIRSAHRLSVEDGFELLVISKFVTPPVMVGSPKLNGKR